MKKVRRRLSLCHIVWTIGASLFASGVFFPDRLAAFYTTLHAPLIGSEEVNLGNVRSGQTMTRTIQFFNPHLSNVRLMSASATCGCTSVESFTNFVAPLQRGSVKVSIAPSGSGHRSESVLLKTSHGDHRIEIDFTVI